MRHLSWIVLLILFCAQAAFGQPLADRVPEDAVVYIGWRGANDLGPAGQGSHLQGILQTSQVQNLAVDVLTQIERATAQRGDATLRLYKFLRALAIASWQYPTALYVPAMPFPASGPAPDPCLAVLWQAGDQAEQLLASLQGLSPAQPGGIPVLVAQRDGLVVLTAGIPAKQATAVGQKLAKSLLQAPAFVQALGKAGGPDAVAVAYVHAQSLIETLDGAAAKRNNGKWTQLKAQLGLGGLKQAIWAARFEGRDWASSVFIDAPAPRQGLLASLDAPSVSRATLEQAPKAAQAVFAANLDPGPLLEKLRQLLTAAEPGGPERLDAMLAQAQLLTGVNLEKDLLQTLGNEWLIYSDAAVVGPTGMGMVLINQARDAAVLEQALSKLETLANMMMAQRQQPGSPRAEFQLSEQEGVKLHALTFPFIMMPTWAVHQGKLILGVTPQAVLMATAYRKLEPGSILENETYVAMQKRLNVANAHRLSFIDLPQTAPAAYQGLVAGIQLLSVTLAAQPGAPQMPAILLPPLMMLQPHLSPAGAACWTAADGFHSRQISPFPGSTMLSPKALMDLPAFSVGIGILLPALGAARRTARQMQASTQARGIHSSCVLWAHGHDGKYPPDIAALVQANYFTAHYVLSPIEDKKVPAEFDRWPREQQSAWINANSSYILVPGRTDDLDAAKIVIFEKLHTPDYQRAIAIAYNDNHVEFTPLDKARELILEQTGKSLEAWSGQPVVEEAGAEPTAPRAPR